MNRKFLLSLMMLILMTMVCTFTFAADSIDVPGTAINALPHVKVGIDDGNSVVKIMGDIYIPKGRVVDGDVVAVLGNIKVDGQVRGDVVAVLGDIEINNVVEGNAVSVLGNIHKGPKGRVLGEFVEMNGPGINLIPDKHFSFLIKHFTHNWGLKLFNMVTLFGASALVLALIPDKTKSMTHELGQDSLRKLFIGFIAMVLIPVILFIVAISIIGLPLLPFVILAVIVAKFIGYVSVALFVGNRIKNAASMRLNIFLELFLGIVVLWLIRLIPFIGFLSYLAVTMIALGLVIDTKFGTNEPWFKKRDYSPIEELNISVPKNLTEEKKQNEENR